jgi:hypothetical protein
MDVLNFISWIKAGNYRESLPTDVPNLLAVGSRDVTRDDAWLPMAVNAEPLQSLYDNGTVTQTIVSSNPVTLNSRNGVIETVALITAATGQESFVFNNTNLTANSTVLLTVEYFNAGFPVVSFGNLSNGSLTLVISNVDTLNALNGAVRIHFVIINS